MNNFLLNSPAQRTNNTSLSIELVNSFSSTIFFISYGWQPDCTSYSVWVSDCGINMEEGGYLNVITPEISSVRHDGCCDYALQLLIAASVELLVTNTRGASIRMACCSYWPFMEQLEESRCYRAQTWCMAEWTCEQCEGVFAALLGSHVCVAPRWSRVRWRAGAFPASLHVLMNRRPLSSGSLPAPAYMISRNSGSAWSWRCRVIYYIHANSGWLIYVTFHSF